MAKRHRQAWRRPARGNAGKWRSCGVRAALAGSALDSRAGRVTSGQRERRLANTLFTLAGLLVLATLLLAFTFVGLIAAVLAVASLIGGIVVRARSRPPT